jgi:D-alanyl-D-alanine dipeptidase
MGKKWGVLGVILLVFISGCSRGSEALVLSAAPEEKAIQIESVQAAPSKVVKDPLGEVSKEVLKEETTKEEAIKEVKEETKKEQKTIKEVKSLVQIKDLDDSIVVDLKYAAEDNFTHKKIYPVAVCLIRKETGAKLVKVNEELKKHGYTLKVWDAYRPPYVQKILWETTPDKRFVANPYKGGSKHNRGSAVDVTLVDSSGKEVAMPTGFDDFSSKASRSNKNITKEVKENLELLTTLMKKHGFTTINSEWWHYDDSEYKKYPIEDVKLDEFLK